MVRRKWGQAPSTTGSAVVIRVADGACPLFRAAPPGQQHGAPWKRGTGTFARLRSQSPSSTRSARTGSAVGIVSVIGYTPDVFMGPLDVIGQCRIGRLQQHDDAREALRHRVMDLAGKPLPLGGSTGLALTDEQVQEQQVGVDAVALGQVHLEAVPTGLLAAHHGAGLDHLRTDVLEANGRLVDVHAIALAQREGHR